jgi:carbamoyl-phosphate synthase large subunit
MSQAPLRGRVLITGAGGPAAISVMRAVAAEPLTMFAADMDPLAAGLYLVPRENRVMVPRGDDPSFVEVVVDRCRRLNIDVLVPTVDSELLPVAENIERFAAHGVQVVVSPAETLRVCLDKWMLHQRCRGAVRGLAATAVLDGHFDSSGWDFPVIVKPRTGSGSRGICLIRSPGQLGALKRDGTLLVQQHLPGVEHSLDVLATAEGDVVSVVPRARLKVDSGIAVTARSVASAELERFGREVAERIGVTYVANVQVKNDANGNPRLLEVNPRFPGSMPLTVASGVNMPRLCLAAALGSPIPNRWIPFEELAMTRYFEERFFPTEDLVALQNEARRVGGQPAPQR